MIEVSRGPNTSKQSFIMDVGITSIRPEVGKLRPAGHIRPADRFGPAREIVREIFEFFEFGFLAGFFWLTWDVSPTCYGYSTPFSHHISMCVPVFTLN